MKRTSLTESQKVALSEIRTELRLLWRSEGLDSNAVIRALSHNLIVYITGDESTVQQTIEQMVEISTAGLGRVICIQSNPSPEDSVDAWVKLHCELQGNRQVCGEVIVLTVSGRMREEVHSTVLSLLAPDIPVYLWWTNCPDNDDHLYTELATEADRILVDSDNFSLPGDLVKLASQDNYSISDLAWAKLTAWRHQIANLWDIPDLHPVLDHLRTMDIVYVAPDDFANANRALLLLGWLADRFEWEMMDAATGPTGGYISHWRKWRWEGKAEIVESAYAGLPPGEIVSVYLQAGKQPPFVMPRLEYVEERQCIDVRTDDASPSARRHSARFSPMTTAEALMEEIRNLQDPYYLLALQRAAEIVKSAYSP